MYKRQDDETENDFDVQSVKDDAKISLNIGFGLVSLVSQSDENSLVPSITKLRKETSKRLGFVIPGVRIRDDIDLEPSQYQIKIGEKIVKHQARRFGYTKFGTNRFFRGFIDLITLWFMNKFGKRPMHFFGLWGTIMLFIGLTFTIYLGIDKLYFDTGARLITSPVSYTHLTLPTKRIV